MAGPAKDFVADTRQGVSRMAGRAGRRLRAGRLPKGRAHCGQAGMGPPDVPARGYSRE